MYLHLMYSYKHFIFIDISSWSHLLLESFWSLVKLHAFPCLLILVTDVSSNWNLENMKIRDKSENFPFQVWIALLGNGQKICIFKEGRVAQLGVWGSFLGGGWYSGAGKGNPPMGEGFTQVELEAYFNI